MKKTARLGMRLLKGGWQRGRKRGPKDYFLGYPCPPSLNSKIQGIHVPPSPIILYGAPINWRVKNHVVFGLQLQVLQWANLISEDIFVILGPNGLGSYKNWLTEALFSSSILAFKKGFLGVLNGPWIGTCMIMVGQNVEFWKRESGVIVEYYWIGHKNQP